MNRRFVRSLLLAALLVLLCTQVFAAQETLAALRLDPESGFTTRMEDTDGNTLTRSGVLNPDGLANSVRSAKIASYSIYYNGRLLMTVTPVGFSEPDAAVMSGGAPTCTGFYKTTFSIDDTREIFLTGLTESTLEQVQTELTASALEDRYFSLTNVDFIDAEKEFTDVAEGEIASDANLCWAAASSNMLRFSGWGSEAGFRTEDDLFESFISAFTDAGGSYTYGLDWFFNGYYAMRGNDGWAQLRAPGESGKYLSEYPADSLYQTYEISNHIDNLRPVLDALERDCAVGISIGNYLSSFRIGGHAITLWGYLHDTSASPYSKEAYPAIFISDSDSDKYDGALRPPGAEPAARHDDGRDVRRLRRPTAGSWTIPRRSRGGSKALPFWNPTAQSWSRTPPVPTTKTPRRIFPFRICTSALPRLMIWSLALIRSLPTNPSKSAGSR